MRHRTVANLSDLDSASKLATARAFDPETASTSLGTLLRLGPVTGNEMPDWLL